MVSRRQDQTSSPASLSAALAELGFQATVPTPGVDEAVRLGPTAFRVTCSRAAMTTRVSVTVLAGSPDQGRDLAEQALAEMDRTVPILNRHVPSSAVSVLNDQGRLRTPPPEVTAVLREAHRLHGMTAGTFDVTVKPLVDHLTAPGTPSPGPAPAELMALVDMGALRLRRRSVKLDKAGMGITLDGIAKGYVVDRMAEVLRRLKARDWLIDAGGDIRVSGTREDRRPWRIGVQNPDKHGEYPAITTLDSGAVATSGGYERPNHIVDSTTGRPPALVRSATVCAPTTMMADALATTLFAMEPRRAVAFIDAIPGCACLILDSAGETLVSRCWRHDPTSTSLD